MMMPTMLMINKIRKINLELTFDALSRAIPNFTIPQFEHI